MEAKRAKIIGLFQGGKSATEICKSLKEDNVGRKLVYRTVKRYRETGSLQDRARSGRRRS